MQDVFRNMLNNTFWYMEFQPSSTLGALFLTPINTAIRLGAVWLTIVVVRHALNYQL